MFTGIIEELGQVRFLQKGDKSAKISLKAKIVNQDIAIGDSVATNGVCLTIIEYSKEHIVAEVMNETLERTSIGSLKTDDKVNLERALRLDSRLGGHIVTGHVDGTGKIVSKKKEGIAQLIDISYPENLAKYLAPKGSVAIDGISLTVVSAEDNYLRVSVIPHSIQMTTLGFKNVGDIVNIEIDVLARYIERIYGFQNNKKEKSRISEEFLIENGFM